MAKAFWILWLSFCYSLGWAQQDFFTRVVESRASVAPAVTQGLAKYEPERGCYLGAYLDLDPDMTREFIDQTGKRRRYPEEFESKVGKAHAIYFFYLGYGQRLPSDWVAYLDSQQKFVHIALEPNGGLEEVLDDQYLQGLADAMAQSRARIFLRFASEMNGPWVNYHGDPALYREKFKLVARVMRERAPNVAMVWCPYAMPTSPIPSYYPGDDWVDWVGVNLYNVTYFNQNRATPAMHVEPEDLLAYVYNRYSKRKPIMICEYATTHFSALENKTVIPFAVDNIKRLFRLLPSKFPRVKGINYFNSNNIQVETRRNNDYRVTSNATVRAAYQSAVASSYWLTAPVLARSAPTVSKEVLTEPVDLGQVTRIMANFKPREGVLARFLLDGEVIQSQAAQDGYTTTLIPGRLKAGERILTFEAFDMSGKIVESRTLLVVVR